MNITLYFIIISAAWIALLFYPRFTKIQLWKTVLAACCSFCPLLLTGTFSWQEMGYRISWVIFDILAVSYFTLTSLSCLTAFVWNTVDIARYSKKTNPKNCCGHADNWRSGSSSSFISCSSAFRSSSAWAAECPIFAPIGSILSNEGLF